MPSTRNSRWTAPLFVAGVTLAGVAVVAMGLMTGPLHTSPIAWAFVGCLFLTEFRPVSWIRRGSAEVTASWTFAFALILIAPVGLALLALWAASFAGDFVRSKGLKRAGFNASQLALSLAAGAATLEVLTGSHVQPADPTFLWMICVVVAAAVIFTTNGVLTGLVIALHTKRLVRTTLPAVVLLNVFTDGLLLCVAPIFVVVSRATPALLPLLALTTWAVYRSACVAETRQYEANHDALTGLPNRAAFQREASAALKTADVCGGRTGIVIIDLDSFKLINDELGHEIGDRVLEEVANRLEDIRRPTDLVARLAGDEFALLIDADGDPDAPMLVAERMHAALRQPFALHGVPITIDASFGVAVSPEHGRDLEALLRHADIAMYAAKSGGSGVRTYDTRNDRRRTGRISLLSELHQAIDHDQLTLEYQPEVSLSTGTIIGVEALVRWDHPTLGRIPPDQFVPLAEQTDLMLPFTEWVLDSAITDCLAWSERGFDVAVAVNISAQNLRDRHFSRKIAHQLASAGLAPERLELEITENTVMTDHGRAISMLAKLRDLGVSVAIDDFGTGYSSIAALRTLPIDRVKIDRSFVSSMLTHPSDLAIVHSLIDLSRRLGLATVAEGVETAAVRDRLSEFGCDAAQGYLFMRPVTSQQLLASFRAHSRELAWAGSR